MTSYEFEKVAKNAVSKVLDENYALTIPLADLQLVWMAHLLGFKKCTVYCPAMGSLYAEVTYNRDKEELYVDIYKKKLNVKINKDEFNFIAEAKEE